MNYSIYQTPEMTMPDVSEYSAPQDTDRIQAILDRMGKKEEPDPNAVDPALLNQLLSSGAQMSQAAAMRMAQQQPSSSAPMMGSMIGQLGKMFGPDAAGNSGAAGTVDTSRPLPLDPNLPGGNQSMFDAIKDGNGFTGQTPPFLPTSNTSPSSMVNSIFGKMKNSPFAQITSDPSGYMSKTPIGNMYGSFADPFTRSQMLQPLTSGLGSMTSGLSALGSGIGAGAGALGSGAAALGSGAAAGASSLAAMLPAMLAFI